MHPTEAAREHVVASHRETVAAVLAAADAAATPLEQPAPREAVVAAMERAVDDDLRADLVDLLAGAVAATGRELLAEPVAAPPYLALTGPGPLVRATLDDGRLVVVVRAFDLDAESGDYVRGTDDPAAAVSVRFRRVP